MLVAQSSLTTLLYTTLAAAALVHAAVAGHQPRSRQQAARHQHLARHDADAGAEFSHALEKRGTQYGKATFYNAETGQQGACGGYIGNSDWVVAIKGTMYGDYGRKSYWCGKLIDITANGKTARNVRIGDACPGCPEGASLDMTPGLFSYFANQDVGVIDIKWHLAGEADEWRPIESIKSIWSPAPSPTTEKKEEKSKHEVKLNWTPEYVPPTTTTSSRQWTPSSSSQQKTWSSSSSSKEWTPSATSSSWNATRTASLNATASISSSSTFTNSTAVASLIRGNNTVALQPSTPGGLPPIRPASNRNGNSVTTKGNLHRAAQIVLDVAGLAYAASHPK